MDYQNISTIPRDRTTEHSFTYLCMLLMNGDVKHRLVSNSSHHLIRSCDLFNNNNNKRAHRELNLKK